MSSRAHLHQVTIARARGRREQQSRSVRRRHRARLVGWRVSQSLRGARAVGSLAPQVLRAALTIRREYDPAIIRHPRRLDVQCRVGRHTREDVSRQIQGPDVLLRFPVAQRDDTRAIVRDPELQVRMWRRGQRLAPALSIDRAQRSSERVVAGGMCVDERPVR